MGVARDATPTWTGGFTAIDAGGFSEFRRCAICGRELADPASRQRGVGPECFPYGPPAIERAVVFAREYDRRLREADAAGRPPPSVRAGRLVDERTMLVVCEAFTPPGALPLTNWGIYREPEQAHEQVC